ncbi:MAG: DUF1761 domain-containing protein [Candidatus Wenzhouxiangella sp. M2_3B_020]
MFEHIHWLGVLVATTASFAIGAVWYSPLLFAGPWQRALGLSDDDLRSGHVGRIFLVAFVAMLVAAIGFSMLLGEAAGWREGLHWGLVSGLLLVAPSLAVHNAFERRPFHFWAINAGYSTVTFIVYGLILGGWPG